MTTNFTSILFLFLILLPVVTNAQLTRERAIPDAPVDDVFWATTNIGISTVRNISARNLNSSVSHTFGRVEGGIDRFFGMDDGANTRLGLDYGVTNRFSLGIGRMTFLKVVDVRSKYNIMRQTSSGTIPVDVGIKLSLGISTISGLNMDFQDRLSYLSSLMVARKFGDLSFQLSPMFAHFNTTNEVDQNQLYGLGILANYELSDRIAISSEYLPVLGDRNRGTSDAMAVAINIDTGGHIFQLYFTSSQWHNEQYIMARNNDRFWEGDIRFGFNIHRVFGLGRR